MEMVLVNERYMDMISGEFAYDPVRLPLEQDPTQALYDRKTLENIWETNHEALNPYTRQWFDINSAIPQTELRREMEHYIELHKIPSDAGELDVIAEYTVILDEVQMNQHLNMLCDYISERLIRKKHYWVAIWKKINLLRLCCRFHDENIQTFRFLHGFGYFHRLIIHMDCLLESSPSEKDIRELGFLDVYKEMARAIDVIGMRPPDIVVKRSVGFYSNLGLIGMLLYTYLNSTGFLKFQSVVLRVLCTTFDQIAVDSLFGNDVYRQLIRDPGLNVAMHMLSRVDAMDISGEDLNHGIAILQAAWILSVNVDFYDEFLKVLANAVIICIAREIPQRSQKIGGFRDGQVIEIQNQARHNSEALEKGLWVIKDLLIEGGPLAQSFQDLRGSDLVTEIVGMFERFTEVQNEDKDGPKGGLICPGGCNEFDCVHIRIAQLGLGISTAISKGEPDNFEIEVLRTFLTTCRDRGSSSSSS